MQNQQSISGEFVNLANERYYKISNVDQMAPFFISVVSSSDHWLFVSSTGCLSAGRIRPENALFPYRSVDHIHESADNTGPRTLVRVSTESGQALWQPFNPHLEGQYAIERHLYKNTIGDKLLFEEVNHDLQIAFRYSWATSEEFGFIRRSEIINLSDQEKTIELIDGVQNLLPSGAPLAALQTRSALVDAYKWNEIVDKGPIALYSMYAMLSDRAAPAESLRTTTAFSLDNDDRNILLSSAQLRTFVQGQEITPETLTKGARGAYLIHKSITLKAKEINHWYIVADIDKSHADVSRMTLTKCSELDLERSITDNHNQLKHLMSGADAWQLTEQENTCVHHYANVLFNNMRGGVFADGYQLEKHDVVATFEATNCAVVSRNQAFIEQLPEKFSHTELVAKAKEVGDEQLIRLCYEYLPLTFGRRHGDPSRPWNHYEIKVKNERGEPLLSYQGNWRDIFQNWEASALSYPHYLTAFIAKFTNASTADGYNPYRITKQGIDWEILDLDDPWSNIGYWGDHQIIYLLKFLELANRYQQSELIELLSRECFSYANVPYELCDEVALFENPKDTVGFDTELQERIEQQVKELGSDGRLMLDENGEVYQVNLTEKILVPLLAKMSNFILDGGIWLNTQRPEWNDANNAIVGNGLSMVTLYYIRRYLAFMQELLCKAPANLDLSVEIVEWLQSTVQILEAAGKEIRQKTVTRQTRRALVTQLAKAGADYRSKLYRTRQFSGKTQVDLGALHKLVEVSLVVVDETISNNLREDGLFNAYNILNYSSENLEVSELYPMLEGQVAVLSSGVLTPKQAVQLLENLFASEMYREDQHSFMLYPDRELSRFVEKNQIPADLVSNNEWLQRMLARDDQRIINLDLHGNYHFHPDFDNADALKSVMAQVEQDYSEVSNEDRSQLLATYEEVFNHKQFTGRSGTMFGYEGLGCIYWHMVSKLLLAVQENYQASFELNPTSSETKRLAEFYYQVRDGIGFNKTPENYGAFPTDPYSHTPKQAGAQQPGMTGQVKEEVITRFGELGIGVKDGVITVMPTLLKKEEFLSQSAMFNFENLHGKPQGVWVNSDELAFTYCQVPFVYQLTDSESQSIAVKLADGSLEERKGQELPHSLSQMIFARSGDVVEVRVKVPVSTVM
ncbi:hypothetical protein [Vibrio sp. SCSIO 43136]|uniref:hypothetical protein n=1 Tax=Vibrio sp. SCSIO 43136 TaxID=2819101 RepID=UPI0020754DA5|nr:hypothetical protein [Vibrio sp. SCSIO 43136]USD67066.1 hypothetical protein J4N39_20745 [Vibrio sp. SCSIO 43136]